MLYWANIFLLGAALTPPGLRRAFGAIRDEARGEASRAVKRRIVVGQSLYALGALAGLVNVPLGVAIIILIQLNYAFAPRWTNWS